MRRLLARLLGVIRKETVELLRQPGLLAILVIGPLLILLLFGSGVRATDPAVTSIFVAPADNPDIAEIVDEYADSQSERLTIEEITTDEDAARQRLRRGDVDLVIIVPSDPLEQIQEGENAVIQVLHRLIDPIEVQAIQLFTRGAVDDLNDLLVADAIEEAQRLAEESSLDVDEARGDLDAVQEAQAEVAAEAAGLRDSLDQLQGSVADFVAIDPAVLAAPLRGESSGVGGDVDTSSFYAPAVIALIIQHLTITFVALSVTREREQGTPELFAVSPLRPIERVAGKSVAYLLIGAVLSAAMLAGVTLLLGTPLRGGIGPVALVLVLEIAAAIGVGFLLAEIARNTTQVVQASMLVLLTSVFFGGLLISADRLLPWARPVGWILPMTHALVPLRDTMLRGAPVRTLPLLVLGAMAVGLGGVAALVSRLSHRG